MRRLTAFATMIAVLFLALGNTATGQAPPAPVVRVQFRTEGLPLSGPFDIVNQTLRFPSGATTPWHTHPGQLLVTVIEGAQIFRVHGTEQVYQTGDSFIELPNHVAQAHNHTATTTVVAFSAVLPDGAPVSVPQPGDTTPPPRPVAGYEFRTDGLPITAPYDMLQQVQDFPPGAATPWHTHPGQLLVTVLVGELTFNVNNADRVYRAGESFVEVPNQVAEARNVTRARTTVLATAFLPKGAPFSHAVPDAPQSPALPDTGAEQWHRPVLMLATVLLLGGIAARRHRMRGKV